MLDGRFVVGSRVRVGGVTVDLVALLGPSGVRPLRDVVTQVDASSVTRWLAGGRLLRPLPGVLALPAAMSTWRGRATAAVTWSGGTLSGRTSLALWDLTGHPGARLHLAVGRHHNVPPVPDWLLPHRVDVPARCVREGLPVTPVAAALLETWGHAHVRSAVDGDLVVARAAVIGAVRRRQVTVPGLRRELTRHPLLPGRRGLVDLVDLIAGGCQSEFEIWGLRHLLDVPGLPPVQQQFPCTPGSAPSTSTERSSGPGSAWNSTARSTTGAPTSASTTSAAMRLRSPRGG